MIHHVKDDENSPTKSASNLPGSRLLLKSCLQMGKNNLFHLISSLQGYVCYNNVSSMKVDFPNVLYGAPRTFFLLMDGTIQATI